MSLDLLGALQLYGRECRAQRGKGLREIKGVLSVLGVVVRG